MKTMLKYGLSLALSIFASDAMAEVTLVIDGEEFALSELMDNCKSITGDAEAQIGCFNALSKLLDEQTAAAQENNGGVAEALEALRSVAQYQDNDSGLTISGAGCKVQFTYFANYFHISRRNVSSIDLFSAAFDASKLQLDQVAEGSGPLAKGMMDAGVTAATWGGQALESSEHNFSPKSARTAIDVYANEVVSELTPRENEAFDFVLVHPQRNGAREDIWAAFEAYVTACKG